jgi:class 3 adenylate cyclase
MRVDRWFAFVDLSGFTSFSDEHGDEESVSVLTAFRQSVRTVATDFGVRIAKWLGDGCMLVSVDPANVVAAVCRLEALVDDAELPLQIHAGMAGGAVILLEGDDYTGGAVNLASRLADLAGPHQIFTTPYLASFAPEGTPRESGGFRSVSGMHDPVEVVCLGCTRTRSVPAGS